MVGIIGTTSPLPPISLLVLVLLLLLLHSTCESFQFRWDGISRLGGWPTAKITKSTTTTTSTSVVVIDRGNPRHAVIGHRDDEDDRSSWRLHAAVRPDEVEIGDDDDDDYDDETEMEEDTVEKKTVRPPPSRTPRNIGSAGGTRTPAAADFASVGDFDARLDVEIRGALRRAEIDLARMTMVGGGDDGGGGGDGGGEVITFAAETPGERLMREYESIDVTATSSSSPSPVSSIDEDADNDGATLLMEARREADEAESMLRLAEEEAARWERELAYLEREAEIADIVSSASAERVSLSSMADAYRVALDAANDNVEVLMAQVAGLESELIDVKSRMERSVEERERIGAEYAFLAKNYGDLKRRSEEGSSSSGSADGASTRLSIDLLNGEIEAYKSRIADAETRLDIMELSLAEAKDEAEKWRNMHDEVMSRMETAAKAREAEHAEEMRVERESYELRALEANANLEEEKLRLRLEADGIIDAMRAEFDRSIEDNTKMISALREALRKTRREGKKAIEESSSTSAAEVDNIRTRMNEEVANLKSVLKSVQGEMDEKEREVQRAMEGREETEKLMEEIRVLRLSFENERMKSAQDSAEYEERLSSFVDTENAFKRQLEEKEGLISSLTREMDASTKQVEALKLELKILEGKVQDAQSSEASNAALMREFADERCGMEIRVAETEEKIAFLEEELKTKRDAVSSAEMALDESRKALDAVRTQYVEKTESAKKLEEELRITVAKLADAEASRLQSESQGKEASTKMIQSLQSQTSDLAVQLKAANDDANESKQKLKDYEAKIVSMQENLTKLSSDLKLQLNEKEGTIIRLMQEKDASVKQVEAMKLEMEALESMANDARSLEALNASLMKELSDERSAMESLLARTEQKTASLEKELKAQRDALTSTEKALDEAQTALDSVRTQYAGEEASVKKLEAELETMKAKLADAEASQQKSASQERDASAKQIRLLQTQASSLAIQLKEANVKARMSEQKLIDYEAKIESMQGTLMQSSTNVLERAKELAATKDEANLAIAEQTKINERLRSELDRVRKEMSASLAEANVEITQRGAILEKKERMLAELQNKYDSIFDQMEKANASAKEKIELQVEQFRNMEASKSEEISSLAAQISQLRMEISSVKSDAQKTITALNSEIKNITQEIKQERKLRDEVMKNKSGLERSLMLAVQNAEKTTRDTSLQLEQMSHQIEKSNAAAVGEAEKSRQLLLDLKEMSELLTKADVQIKERDDALRTKESALSELQIENQSLLGEIKKVQVTSQKAVSSKSAEINALKDMVANLTANVDMEIKLRQDVITGKMTAESLLQTKLDEATSAMEKLRVDAQRTIDKQALQLRSLENSASKEKSALTSEISQLKKDMSIFQANAQKAIDARTNEIRNLDQVVANLKETIAEEKKLKEVAMQGKSELEKALQTKIDQLSEAITTAQKNAAASVQEKNMELDRLDARIKELTNAVNSEVALKMQATKERTDIDRQLRARIAQLEKELADDRAESHSALTQRDTLLSSIQVEFKRLSEAKDEVQKDRDAVEKDLMTKIFELKNKMSAIQMNSDRTIKSKSDEVDNLKAKILEETKSRDGLIKKKSDELAKMEKDLRAESELVAQLSKKIGAARTDAVEAIAAEKKALAELERLKNDDKSSQMALSKPKSEPEVEQSPTNVRESMVQLTKQVADDALKKNLVFSASISKQQLKTREREQDYIQKQSKPKGFGKPALKKPSTEAPLPPQTVLSTDNIAVEGAQQVGDVRSTEPPDVIVNRIDVAARKLQTRKETSMSILPTPAPPAEAGRRKNALRQLVTPRGRGNAFKRNTAEGPSSQTANAGRSVSKNPLAELLVANSEQNQASFPRRKAVPAPSSQLSPSRQRSPSTPKKTVLSPSSQGDTRKHGSAPITKVAPRAPSSQGTSSTQSIPSFPKREEAVSWPSSQASVPRQGAPAAQVNSPASTILGVSLKKSPLTSLALGASVIETFPKRKYVSTPSSQATSRALDEKERLSLSDRVRTRPNRTSTEPKAENESVAVKKMSLKDLIPSIGKPIGSYGNKQTTTFLGGMASPEQKRDNDEDSGSIYKSVKKRSLKDLLPSKGTLGSYGKKKTTTILRGIASPEQATSTLKVEKQNAMKDEVMASMTAIVATSKEESVKSKSTAPSYSSLSAIIQSQNPRQISHLHGRYKKQNTQVKLRAMAKDAVKEVESPSKQLSLEIAAENFASTDNESMDTVAVSMKIQEAFQRALLSARIANDAKAKVFKSLHKYRNASLSQVVPSQTKPTLSQQKAFANSNRRTSLFPEKFASHLSRLLQK